MIAATIGGPITIANKIPLIMSLKNSNSVCCKMKNKLINTNVLNNKTKLH